MTKIDRSIYYVLRTSDKVLLKFHPNRPLNKRFGLCARDVYLCVCVCKAAIFHYKVWAEYWYSCDTYNIHCAEEEKKVHLNWLACLQCFWNNNGPRKKSTQKNAHATQHNTNNWYVYNDVSVCVCTEHRRHCTVAYIWIYSGNYRNMLAMLAPCVISLVIVYPEYSVRLNVSDCERACVCVCTFEVHETNALEHNHYLQDLFTL